MLALALQTLPPMADNHPSFFIGIGVGFYGGVGIHVVSFVLGVISLFQKQRKRQTAVISVVLSGLTLITVGIAWFGRSRACSTIEQVPLTHARWCWLKFHNQGLEIRVQPQHVAACHNLILMNM